METLLACVRARTTHFDIPPWLFWTMWLGFFGLVVLMLYAKSREIKKRREGLEQLGMEMGFTFTDKPDDGLAAQLAQIQVSGPQLDYKPRYGNILQGSVGGQQTVIADRTVGSGKNQTTSTVVALKFATPLPLFVLYPENVFWRVAEKLGYSDIDFDGAPDFSRRFFLHGQDATAVRALFKPEVTQAFEQLDPKTHFCVSGSGAWLLVYRPGRLIAVQDLRGFLQQTEPLAAAFRRAQSGSAFR